MVDTTDNVRVRVSLEGAAFAQREADKWQRGFERATGGAAGAMKRAELQISSSMKAIAAALGAGFSVAAVKSLTDAYTSMQNRLRVTGLEGAALATQYKELNRVADASRSSIEATVDVYSRLRLASEGMGFTNEEVTRTTEILGKALSASGATAQESAAALLQFGQAVGSGVLQGDELRSIRESAPAVARAIAKEFDTTVGGLKKLGEEGKLTSERVMRAVLAAGGEIDAVFAKTEATIGNALTDFRNKFLNFIGAADESVGVTDKASAAIKLMADNIHIITPALGIIVGLLGVKYAAAAAVSTAATVRDGLAKSRAAIQTKAYTDALMANAGMLNKQAIAANVAAASTTGLAGSARVAGSALLAAFGGPVGVAIMAVGLALGFVAAEAIAHNASLKALKKTYEEYEAEQRAVASATKTANKEQKELIKQIDPAIVKLANQTGQVNKLSEAWFQLAAAARLAAIEQARADALTARTDADKAKKLRDRNRMFASGLLTNPETGQVQGNPSQFKEVQETDKIYEGLDKRADEYEERLKRLQTDAITPLPVPKATAGTEDSKKTSKSDAAAAKRREETAETLRLERELLLAQETGDKKRIQAAEDAIRLRQLLNQYAESGAADVAKSAGEHLAIEQRIRDSEEAREETQKRINAMLDKAQENTERYAREVERLKSIEDDRLNTQLELARLRGNPEAIKAAERELWIEERIAKLREMGVGRGENDKRKRDKILRDEATRQADVRDAAERHGEMRETFSRAFAEGFRALASGDLQTFAANMAGSFAEEALQRLGGELFDAVFGAGKAAAEGGAMGAAQATVVSSAITSASGIGANAMSAAIILAGRTAAASMAAAIAGAEGAGTAKDVANFFKSIPGFAKGTNSAPGGLAIVGERGPELVNLPRGSQVIPNNLLRNIPTGAAMARSAAPQERIIKVLVDKSEYFDVAVESKAAGVAAPMAVQAAQGGAKIGQTQMVQRQRRKMGSF